MKRQGLSSYLYRSILLARPLHSYHCKQSQHGGTHGKTHDELVQEEDESALHFGASRCDCVYLRAGIRTGRQPNAASRRGMLALPLARLRTLRTSATASYRPPDRCARPSRCPPGFAAVPKLQTTAA